MGSSIEYLRRPQEFVPSGRPDNIPRARHEKVQGKVAGERPWLPTHGDI